MLINAEMKILWGFRDLIIYSFRPHSNFPTASFGALVPREHNATEAYLARNLNLQNGGGGGFAKREFRRLFIKILFHASQVYLYLNNEILKLFGMISFINQQTKYILLFFGWFERRFWPTKLKRRQRRAWQWHGICERVKELVIFHNGIEFEHLHTKMKIEGCRHTFHFPYHVTDFRWKNFKKWTHFSVLPTRSIFAMDTCTYLFFCL